ncbi:OLC1v1029027C4 [Oldenlandia corymbosa var. corymbosa]|nr:OLC1v1029027C4 [Oldenlandia corymbosa var. corymbosa]
MLEKLACFGLMPNMTLYLMKQYRMEMASASNVLFYWTAATNFLPILGAILADSYVGRYYMIGFGSAISFLGMILLWSTTLITQEATLPNDDSITSYSKPTVLQLLILYTSFGLISIGGGGLRSSSLAFGVDQLENGDDHQSIGLMERYFSWYYASFTGSLLVALTFLVYIQENLGWSFGFGVSAVLMFFATLSFFLGSPFYIKVKAKASFVMETVQVIVASFRNRNLKLSSSGMDIVFHQKRGSELAFPSENLRFLNKACIIRDPQQDLTADGTATKPWILCTVDQVEGFKVLIKVLPIWSTGMLTFINISQNSFSILQASSMNRKIVGNFEIPAGSLGITTVVSLIIWVAIYDQAIIPIASRIKGKPVSLNTRERMGIGIFLSFLAMVVTASVEFVRRRIANDQGLSDDPQGTVNMSALWLLPQYCLLGVAEAFNAIAQNEFYMSELPKSMSSIASNLCGVGISVASLLASFLMSSIDDWTKRGGQESWISSNINKGHYDYYFWVLSGLSIVNFLYFLICCWTYGPYRSEKEKHADEEALLQ